MSEETKAPEEVAETKAPVQEPAGAELTVNDLNGIREIINVAIQRGAFKPNELVTVGTAYNKLETFLTAVTQAQGKGE